MEIELKLKLKNGKEIVLDQNESKELYNKLKELYDKWNISYPIIVKEYPIYPVPTWQPIWYNSNLNISNGNSNYDSISSIEVKSIT